MAAQQLGRTKAPIYHSAYPQPPLIQYYSHELWCELMCSCSLPDSSSVLNKLFGSSPANVTPLKTKDDLSSQGTSALGNCGSPNPTQIPSVCYY